MQHRKIIVYIAVSADGYIAKEDGNLDWLSAVETPGEDYGYYDFINGIDTVIMGRKTYDKVLTFGIDFPHKDRKCYVLSRTKSGSDDNVSFYNGDAASLAEQLRSTEGKNIFIDGGAEVIHEFMKQGLVDQFILSVIPVFLGGGIRLFKDGRPEHKLRLTRTSTFPSGLVQLWYEK